VAGTGTVVGGSQADLSRTATDRCGRGPSGPDEYAAAIITILRDMRVLVIGAGGVGSAIVSIASRRNVFDALVVADVDAARATRAADRTRNPKVTATSVDASDHDEVLALIRSVDPHVVVNACDPRFNPAIFDGCFTAGCHYIDMAMHLSSPHPTDPYNEVGVLLGQAQIDASQSWTERGLMAIVGMGVEPGLSDVLARYASDNLFTDIDEIGVRDGGNLRIEGLEFAPTFSIWTTIEECLNPPLVYERERGIFTTEPFSEPEIFTFPDGIGPLQCVNVEHEEVILMPMWLDVGRVTFKYGLGEDFIEVLKTLHRLGLDSTRPVRVHGADVSPRDVVAATLPNPAELGHRMTGRTCAGILVRGIGVDGRRHETYLYQVVDNEWTMKEYGHQAVVWQTALHPVVALEMIASGAWADAGVFGPEAFPSEPFLDVIAEVGAPFCVEERIPSSL
jgi:saccharopine dehydrogenase (NAD+, L-lysine forming)